MRCDVQPTESGKGPTMATREVSGVAYECDVCGSAQFSADGDLPAGYYGEITIATADGVETVQFIACRKTHVMRAAKTVLNALDSAAESEPEALRTTAEGDVVPVELVPEPVPEESVEDKPKSGRGRGK